MPLDPVSLFDRVSWRDLVDVGLTTFLFYRLALFVKGTRALMVLYGLISVLGLYVASELFGFTALNWLLTNFLGSFFLVIIILFQRDIRNALAEVGAGRFGKKSVEREEADRGVLQALENLARRKIGALVVIERKIPLSDVVKPGVTLDAKISRELLETLFEPKTPLHDGAVLVRGDRVVSAGCVLPLAVGGEETQGLGTRHRAALGVSEESDALVLVASEERGTISAALAGRLHRDLDPAKLRRLVKKTLEG